MNIPELPLARPIEWILVPAGKVTIQGEMFGYVRKGQTKTFDVPEFHISKYPISNAQFLQFIAAGGYSQKKWWSHSGWLVKERNGWNPPPYWDHFSGSLHSPKIGVSWFEAMAFCLWLTHEARALVMLPTEQQWQLATEDGYWLSGIDLTANVVEWCEPN